MNVGVTAVEVRRAEAVLITFDDGVEARFPVADLRAACPCAGCRGQREGGGRAWPQPGQPEVISVVDAELTGAWGISLRWSDGHDTGIYSWDVLRRWWDGGLHGAMVIDPVPGSPAAQG